MKFEVYRGADSPSTVEVRESVLLRLRVFVGTAMRSTLTLFFVALAVRLLSLHARQIADTAGPDSLSFGWEVGRIAQSLLQGNGYSSPFVYETGPTAWLGPVYPLLMYGCFKLFGLYTLGAAAAILALNSLFAALTCVVISRIGRETLNEEAGWIAAWFFALAPFEIAFASRWIWDTSLSALLLSLVFWLTLRAEDSNRLREWLELGLLWGVIALSNPSLLSFMPVAIGWLCYRQRGRRTFTHALSLATIFVLVLSPWVIRNYRVFGKFIPMRSNLAMELWLGNHEGANGFIMTWDHPVWNAAEMAAYAHLGETAYLQQKMQAFRQFVEAHPLRFAELSLKRVLVFWAGVPEIGRLVPRFGMGTRQAIYFASSIVSFWGMIRMLRRGERGAILYAGVVGLYPLIYYVTHNHARYRHPIEPLMVLMGAYLFYTAAYDKPAFLRRRDSAHSTEQEELIATSNKELAA